MTYEDFFAERLASLREAHNVSAREMSLAIGQNESYINRIENKKSFPSMQAFFYICDYLKITPQYFFDDGTDNPEKINDILKLLRNLSSEQLNIIHSVAHEFTKKDNNSF